MNDELMKSAEGAVATPSGIQLATGETSSTAVAAQAQALVQARFVMARQFPRNILESRRRILEACQRPLFAKAAIYRKPVGGGHVEGPSIRLVEELVRQLGNIDSSSVVIFDDRERRMIRLSSTDLETNATFSQDVIVDKNVERSEAKGRRVISERTNSRGQKVYLLEATDDELLIKAQSLASKGIRTVTGRLVPSDIMQEAMELCKKVAGDADAKDPKDSLRKLVDAFAKDCGVKSGDLEKYLGHSLDVLTAKDITELRGIYTSMKEGITWAEVLADKFSTEAVTVPRPSPVAAVARTVTAADDIKSAPEHGTDAYGDWLVQEYKQAETKEQIKFLTGLHGRAPESWQETLGKQYAVAMKRVKS